MKEYLVVATPAPLTHSLVNLLRSNLLESSVTLSLASLSHSATAGGEPEVAPAAYGVG